MASMQRARKLFHKISEPLINLFVKLKISPNMITTSALGFLAITVYFILEKNTLAAGIMIFVTGIIDALDGAVAKKVGSTKFGDFYDAFIDRFVEATMFIAISIAYPEYYIITFIALVFSFMTSYVAARAEVWTVGVKVKYVGFIGSRSGRTAWLIAAFLLDKIELGLWVIIFAAGITMTIRSILTFKTLAKKD